MEVEICWCGLGCMADAGIVNLHYIEGTMNGDMYKSILSRRMMPSYAKLQGLQLVFQNDTDFSNDQGDDILNKTKVYGFLLMIIGIIVIINFVLRKILILVSVKEERKFYSELESSKIFKVSLALFINTGIIVLVTSLTIVPPRSLGTSNNPQLYCMKDAA